MASIVEVGIDYVTITEKDADKWNGIVWTLETLVYPYMQADGHTFDSTKVLGYQGTQIGTIFVGSRSDSSMVRVSGSEAMRVLSILCDHVAELHVTRIDLQVTVAFDEDRVLYAERSKDAVLAYQEANPKNSHPNVTLISSTGRGDTLQIGSRSSEVFCRIYDKWREQKLDYTPNTWRFEVELKGSTAEKTLQHLRNNRPWINVVHGLVSGTFEARGIQEPSIKTSASKSLVARKTPTDDEKRFKWLRSHVKPTIQRLVQHGYKDEILDMFSDVW